jgi:hypothetical protein
MKYSGIDLNLLKMIPVVSNLAIESAVDYDLNKKIHGIRLSGIVKKSCLKKISPSFRSLAKPICTWSPVAS